MRRALLVMNKEQILQLIELLKKLGVTIVKIETRLIASDNSQVKGEIELTYKTYIKYEP